MISAEKARTPVSMSCRAARRQPLGLLRVAAPGAERPGARRRRWLTEQDPRDPRRRTAASTARRGSTPSCGSAHDIRVGRKRVERLMRQAGIIRPGDSQARPHHGPRARACGSPMTWSSASFSPGQSRTCSGSPTSPTCATWEGWLYLAAVQDAFSPTDRRLVDGRSHARGARHRRARRWRLSRRRPEAGLIHHSDQGSQYVSLAFGQQARDAGIAVSMGSKGDCFDNAVAESFFATLKKELVYRRRTWPTRRALNVGESSSTSRSSTTAREGTPRWGISLPSSMSKDLSIKR